MSAELLEQLNAEGWLTTAQVARLFGVRIRYINELTRRRVGRKPRPPVLAKHKVGHLILVRREDAERYQAAHPRLGTRIALRLAQNNHRTA